MKRFHVFFIVLSTFFICLTGNAQTGCSTLAITGSTPGSVCGGGSVLLSATASGTGDDIYWYDAPTGGNIVGIGPQLQTPAISQTTSFYAAEVLYGGGSGGTLTYCIPVYGQGCALDNIDDFTLTDTGGVKIIEHLNSGCSTTTTTSGYGDFTGNSALIGNLALGATYNFSITHGFCSQFVKIWIDLNQNGVFSDPGELLFVSPFGGCGTTGSITIPAGALGGPTVMRIMDTFGTAGTAPYDPCFPATNYGETHDYQVNITSIACESPRAQVVATVNNIADEEVMTPLPYTHIANTGTYGDNYSGAPGSSCGTTGSYLDGDDVVYHYKPNIDKVVDIELSGLSGSNASLFVYASCADIGQQCLAGTVNASSSSNLSINEFKVFDENDYYIVISTTGTPQSLGYTLTIDESVLNCANYTTPPLGASTQFFTPGQILSDLNVTGANLTWYSDPSGAPAFQIPNTTTLVDATTYYVSQTFNNCESNLLSILVDEQNNCNSFMITGTTGATIPCFGSATLQATGSGTPGAQINWHDAQTGGNLVATGPVFKTPVLSQTSSYWASEVFVGIGLGTLPSGYCIPNYNYAPNPSAAGCTNGAGIKGFILTDSAGVDLITHLNTGCSSPSGQPGYGDFTSNANLTASIIPGKTYSFTVNYISSGNLLVVLYVDFNRNGSFSDAGEKVFSNENSSSLTGPVTGNFTVPSTAMAGAAILRAYSALSLQPISYTTGCEAVAFGETHDYKVNIASLSNACESTRIQVTVTSQTNGDVQISSLPYNAQHTTANYGDPYTGQVGTNCGTDKNYLNGNDAVYKFTAANSTIVDILLSNLSDLYGGVFVYGECADIGTNCLAGAVAGASTANFGIQDFTVVAGEDYYVVVSSWLSPNIGYTLDIIPFSCTTVPLPNGSTTQSFYQGDMLKDLTVGTTLPNASLVWYSDPAGTIQIPDTTTLVDTTIYYVRQTLYNCNAGPLLAITVNQISCASLNATAPDVTIHCKGSTILTATSSGNGDDVYWYDATSNGQLLAIGPNFTTPILTQTTSYYASEIKLAGTSTETGLGELVPGGFGQASFDDHGLVFSVYNTMTLVEVQIFPRDGGVVKLELRNSSDNVLDSTSVAIPNIPGGYDGTTAFTVPLNFFVLPGTGYRLVRSSGQNPDLMMEHTGANYPYPLGSAGEITSAVASTSILSNSYYYFYNWTIIDHGQVLCQSPPDEVKAIVDPAGEVILDYNAITYTASHNSGSFGDNFSGSPGSGCPGANYLDGPDVLYQYTAHPTQDDILSIELTNISAPGTGVFIYDECSDVGVTCLAGKASQAGSSSVSLDNYYMTAGEDIYIVVSSAIGAVNYDIKISGIDCANVPAPTIDDPSPDFIAGEVLTNLQVKGNPHRNQFTWYAELSDIPNTPIANPGQTNMVDAEDYYVTQTVLNNCESSALMIVPNEFDCTALNMVSTPDPFICAPGGEISLAAQGSGNGNELYWYFSQTGGNAINQGPVYNTSVSQTTSFWVAEAFVEVTQFPNQGKEVATGATTSQLYGYGLEFDALQAFTLVSVKVYADNASASTMDMELRDATGNVLQSTSVSVPQGNATAPVTIPLGFTVQTGSNYWLTRTSGPPLVEDSNGNSFPYPLGTAGAIGSITSGRTGSTTSSSYYYFYDWTISQNDLKCESVRQEVLVTVNSQPTPVPTGTASQSFCNGASLSDIVISGTDIKWYENPSGGNPLSLLTPLQDGAIYYATQTLLSCESGNRFAVTINILPDAPPPTAIRNQLFTQGETLVDLDVQGSNLKWYEDQFGAQEITDPANYVLVNQETYYVSQEPNGFCESGLTPITVHLQLGVDLPGFESFAYYPNPVGAMLHIKNSILMDSVVLFNLRGEKIIGRRINAKDFSLDTSGLASGVYLLQVRVNGKTEIFKLIKK